MANLLKAVWRIWNGRSPKCLWAFSIQKQILADFIIRRRKKIHKTSFYEPQTLNIVKKPVFQQLKNFSKSIYINFHSINRVNSNTKNRKWITTRRINIVPICAYLFPRNHRPAWIFVFFSVLQMKIMCLTKCSILESNSDHFLQSWMKIQIPMCGPRSEHFPVVYIASFIYCLRFVNVNSKLFHFDFHRRKLIWNLCVSLKGRSASILSSISNRDGFVQTVYFSLSYEWSNWGSLKPRKSTFVKPKMTIETVKKKKAARCPATKTNENIITINSTLRSFAVWTAPRVQKYVSSFYRSVTTIVYKGDRGEPLTGVKLL